jgi:hypothetical protein
MRIAPEIIAGLCRERARDLLSPRPGDLAQMDAAKLLWAFAGVESSFGLNSAPRHEWGYCYNGRYFDSAATAEIGCLAHCSYGPWQVMYANFPKGIDPRQLIQYDEGRYAAEMSIRACIALLNRALARDTRNVTELVSWYNGPADVPEYTRKFLAAYDRPMPQYTDPVLA